MRAAPVTLRMPRTERGRGTYHELRDMGFGAAYALSVVQAFEHAQSELELWSSALRYVYPDADVARAWLRERGYL